MGKRVGWWKLQPTIKTHVTNLINTRDQVDQLLGQFQVEIKTWYTNLPQIGTVINNTKVLGLTWNIWEDSLKQLVGKTKAKKWTKRHYAL